MNVPIADVTNDVADKPSEAVVDLVRLNTLSDGVYAIAMTLLVLDIRLPENTHAATCRTGWSSLRQECWSI